MSLRYMPNVVTLSLDTERCDGCRMCTLVCPHAVFAVDNGKARLVDRDACMECGACAMNCRTEAITVESGVECAYALLLTKVRRWLPWSDGSGESVSCG